MAESATFIRSLFGPSKVQYTCSKCIARLLSPSRDNGNQDICPVCFEKIVVPDPQPEGCDDKRNEFDKSHAAIFAAFLRRSLKPLLLASLSLIFVVTASAVVYTVIKKTSDAAYAKALQEKEQAAREKARALGAEAFRNGTPRSSADEYPDSWTSGWDSAKAKREGYLAQKRELAERKRRKRIKAELEERIQVCGVYQTEAYYDLLMRGEYYLNELRECQLVEAAASRNFSGYGDDEKYRMKNVMHLGGGVESYRRSLNKNIARINEAMHILEFEAARGVFSEYGIYSARDWHALCEAL